MSKTKHDLFGRPWVAVATAALAVPLLLGGCTSMAGDEVEATGAVSTADITATFSDSSGQVRTITANAVPGTDLTTNNPFFQSLGTNGRACVSCHQPAQAWTISPTEVQNRFNSTQGLDPIFRLNDGSNSPNAPVGTLAQRSAAYSLLRTRGTIRVGIGIPAGAEFSLIFTEDPYGFASASQLSLFRRPLPSTNLKDLGTVMWDGREGSVAIGQTAAAENTARRGLLSNQSNDATLGHAQAAAALPQPTRDAIVNFEMALATAQTNDNAAGDLTANGARGGPTNLSNQAFHVGINDVLGADPAAPGVFSTHVFSIYDAWATGNQTAARASIARGQNIFNTRQFNISGVRGVNDVLGVTNLSGTCTTCHDAPNVGNHSVSLPLDLGLTDPDKFNTNDTPRYTLCKLNTTCTGSNQIRTSDPGRSLIDGKWAHVATFKGPILRGLAARGPYFHNGFAPTLFDVVHFYDTRFHLGLTGTDVNDLIAFLGAT